ncbi:MarR family transcriptional regulator [Sporolactobacillus sp. THM7-4]|nr:MarR family transcriptional regulator [Sporolactobacillus sp. THM7-4]
MSESGKNLLEKIEYEVIMLLRRADFKKTLDGRANSLFRSGYLILSTLLAHSPLTVRELADIFQLDLSTISRQIKALESRGLVARKIGARDGRVNQIYITDSGKKSVTALKEDRLSVYQELLDDWTDEEKNAFAGLLARFNRKIEQRRRLN